MGKRATAFTRADGRILHQMAEERRTQPQREGQLVYPAVIANHNAHVVKTSSTIAAGTNTAPTTATVTLQDRDSSGNYVDWTDANGDAITLEVLNTAGEVNPGAVETVLQVKRTSIGFCIDVEHCG